MFVSQVKQAYEAIIVSSFTKIVYSTKDPAQIINLCEETHTRGFRIKALVINETSILLYKSWPPSAQTRNSTHTHKNAPSARAITHIRGLFLVQLSGIRVRRRALRVHQTLNWSISIGCSSVAKILVIF
jgi:hypothetical protein